MDEWIVPLTDAVVTLLLLVIGGNLGSFLNVVVHRLPRGESVVHGGSHCPACGAAIRWYDNVPVLGWLQLGGRCRDCALPIAARYPLLEAAGALLIGGVAAVELLSGGRTIPGDSFGGGRSGADNLLLRPDPLLISIALLHAWLLFNLLLLCAVEADRQEVPGWWTRSLLLISVAVAAVWPALLPVGLWSGNTAWHTSGPARGLIIALVGMGCGWVLGRGVTGGMRSGLLLAGATLGWQAVAAIALLTPLCAGGRRVVGTLFPPEPPDGGGGVDIDGAGRADATGVPSLLGRLLVPVPIYFRHVQITAGDLVLATAVLLVGWRWGSVLLAAVVG